MDTQAEARIMKAYNKLVRDKIPDIIRDKGEIANTKKLNDTEFFDTLNHKLKEEVDEYFEDYSVEELTDIVEVIYAIARHRGLSINDFEKIRKKKLDERGGFEDRVLLIGVEEQ